MSDTEGNFKLFAPTYSCTLAKYGAENMSDSDTQQVDSTCLGHLG